MQLKIDPVLLQLRPTKKNREDDGGSPTPLARESVPLMELLNMSFCHNANEYDALDRLAATQRQTVQERLDAIDADLRAVRQRDSSAEEKLAVVRLSVVWRWKAWVG